MDIEKLMELHGDKLDWDLIEQYFDIFESREQFEELRGKYRAISDKDRAELLALSRSESMRQDMITVAAQRHNPFTVNGEVCPDRVVEFLTQYNEFLNHPMKPFRPWMENNMKL